MANYLTPGPMCVVNQSYFIDAGTTALTAMPPGDPIAPESSESNINLLNESLQLLDEQAA